MKVDIVEVKTAGTREAIINKVVIGGKIKYVVEMMNGVICEGIAHYNSIQFARVCATKFVGN